MKFQNVCVSLLLMGGFITPLTASSLSPAPGFEYDSIDRDVNRRIAPPRFTNTPGYVSLNQWANNLKGRNFRTDPAFPAYCRMYAKVARRQALRRIQEGCTAAIPLSNNNIRNRWRKNKQPHRNWCRNVSSHASGGEARVRENQLKSCIQNRRPPKPKLTIQKCKSNDKFHKAAARGDINFVRRCLNIGVNANTREGNNWTALHSASSQGRLAIARLLVQKGAYVNARDITNRTPLDQAKRGRHYPVINYLKSMGGVSRD